MMITSIPWSAACGQRLKKKRMECGLSQGQLCQEARIPGIRILSQFECGANSPKQDRFEAICKALGITASEILDGTGAETVETDVISEVPDSKQEESAAPESTNPVQDGFELFPGNSVGERLRFARERNNLSRTFVAEFISVSGAMVGRYEGGLNMISEKGLRTFAELYSCSVENLATEEELAAIRQHDADPVVIRNRGNQSGQKKSTKKDRKKKPVKTQKKKIQKSTKTQKDPSAVGTSDSSVQTTSLKTDIGLAEASASESGSKPEPVADFGNVTIVIPESVENTGSLFNVVEPAKDPLFPDGEPEIEKINGNALELMLLIRKKRQEKGLSESVIASAAGMTTEEYCEYEKAKRDITISQFSLIAKALMIAPFALIRDSFRKEWITFWGEGPKETCAAVGACVVNALPYRYKDGDGFVHIYGDSENLKLIFRNLHISGRFT